MLRHEGESLARVVVCTPRHEYFRVDNFDKHNIGELGSPEIAIRQHDMLKSGMRAFGAEVIDVPELVDHPNSVFTRDTALCTPQGFIKLRLGLTTRQGEGEWMAQCLDGLGEACVGEIHAPGTVEGGDVVLAGKVAFIGRSNRTNDEGIRQLSIFLNSMGYEIRVIPLPPSILHLDKVLMVLGPQRLISCREFVSEETLKGFDATEISSCGRETTANIICLGKNELIVNSSNRLVIERLQADNFIVHVLDLNEFAKGMGGPNCLIMPLERAD